MSHRRASVACAMLLGIAGSAACQPDAERAPTDRPAAASGAPTYVGSQACASCHPKPLEDWRGSHHDLAMQPADASTVLGDFDGAAYTYGGVTSTFHRRDGRFVIRTDGPDGALRDYEVAYAFGVDPLQQYLIRFPGGRLQASGIAWDTRPAAEGGQRWFHLYPDEVIAHDDALHWTGPNQNWNFMCSECHSTHVRKNYRFEEDRFETSWAEIDVACEACHGPGSAHVTWAEAVARGERVAGSGGDGLVVAFGDDASWLFEPGATTARRSQPPRSRAEIEMCARCHSRRALVSEAYVHGGPLMDTHVPALLDEGLYHADGQILDEVYVYGSFLQSRMYARGVSCSDCHEPHGLALRAEGNALCATCHRAEHYDRRAHHFHEPGSAAARCVACHMPARTYMVVDPRRDHGFRVPRPDLTRALGTPNACGDCHADRGVAWAEDQLDAWYGEARERRPHFAAALHAARRGQPQAGRALVELVDDPEQPAIARATALRLLRDLPSAEAQASVERALRDADPLVRAAALEALESRAPSARLRLAEPRLRDPVRVVRLRAASALASVPADRFDAAGRAALERALDEYRDAQWLNADRPDAHLNLGLLHAQRGEFESARAAYESALRLDPEFVPASVNLADLYRMQARDADGARVLLRALEVAPESAELHHALGLLRVRQGRLPDALDALARAAALAPDRTRYAYVYGVALHSSDQGERALSVLAQAHARRPGDRDLLVGLATISRERGDLVAALGYARKLAALAPDDPGARAFVVQLEAERSEP
ncbi:MAG: tetratricopeptide repeat protein [Deltaproteobacteria bacterium]|nr:MAG: tetratricopeptide repeat protein [Deltaproteobacteria bacterium]